MTSSAAPDVRPAQPRIFGILALLWLAGAAMRIPLLVVPPVIPLIHNDLHMTETQVGALMGMPLVMFALAAIPGSLLIARLGAVRVAFLGLLIAALGSAARGTTADVWTLYAATVVMGGGISILQPAMPTLVRLMAADPDRARLGRLHQRHAGRLDHRRRGDHSAGAARAGRKLARQPGGVVGAGAVRGAAVRRGRRGARRRPPMRRRCAGGRTGKARSSGCSA